ncbi:MAG TPA: hypothetical protein VF939_01345 [Puia sp.]
MNEEIFQAVLNEILDEMKVFSQLTKDLQNTVADLKEKVAAFDQRLNEQVVAPPADTFAVQQVIKECLEKTEQLNADSVDKMSHTVSEGFQKVNGVVEAQPKAVVRQLRFVFYPEYNSGNFRFSIKSLFLFGTVLVLISAGVSLVQKWMDNVHSERLQSHYATFPASHSETLSPRPNTLPGESLPTHRRPSGRLKKINMDSLAAASPSIPDSTHTP